MSETLLETLRCGVGVLTGPRRPETPQRMLVQLTILGRATLGDMGQYIELDPGEVRQLVDALVEAYNRIVPSRERLRQLGHTIPAGKRHQPEHCRLCLGNGWRDVPYGPLLRPR